MSRPDRTALLAAAAEAAGRAYAPYSNFGVGAAVLLADGSVVTGANVENASYGLSLCAETVAIAKTANDGRIAEVLEVAIVGGHIGADGLVAAGPVRPCGRCRQILNEAAQRTRLALGTADLLVHCGDAAGGQAETHRLSDLLPVAFGPADLERAP